MGRPTDKLAKRRGKLREAWSSVEIVIKILADNNISQPGFIGEHGFSALIQRGGEKVLFDTGAEVSLPLNLKVFDEKLEGLTKVVLSHGHYDHTKGL